ncbi:MAG: hypothetical protein JWO42_1020, partial [Chloroflexi bacterium]|nr:hypothetical protein [Chloroflexota bacterium]
RLLCATDYGVFESTTTVDRWQMVSGPTAGRSISALSYALGTDTIYAAVVGGGIYAAPAATMHWKLVPNSAQLGYVHVLLADTNGRWLLAGSSRTTNGGKAWQRTGIPAILAAMQLSRHPNVLLAGTAGSGIFRSADGGDHWQNLQSRGINGTNVSALGAGVGTHIGAVYAVVNGLPYTSADNGTTWTPVATLSSGNVITSIGQAPGASGPLVAGTSGGGVVLLKLADTKTPTPVPARATATLTVPPSPVFTKTSSSPTPTASGTPSVTPRVGRSDTPIPPVSTFSATATPIIDHV